MSKEREVAIIDKTESIPESVFKDLVTLIMVSFLVYISQGSTWWTFVCGLMFILFMIAKIASIMKRQKVFKSKEELKNWIDELEW